MLESQSELEQLRSTTNEVVFRLNGKMLSSKVDPRKEAALWIEQNQLLAKYSKTIVVIGIGSGYHLISLKEKHPQAQIIAVSSSQALLDAVQVAHKDAVAGISFYCANTIEDFYEAEATQGVFATTTVVLKHPTYRVEESEVLDAIEEAIIARTFGTLRKYIAKNEPLTVTLPSIPVMIGLASIKTVNDAAVNSADMVFGSPWLAIRTLNELVK